MASLYLFGFEHRLSALLPYAETPPKGVYFQILFKSRFDYHQEIFDFFGGWSAYHLQMSAIPPISPFIPAL
jgi:hypothetical protein